MVLELRSTQGSILLLTEGVPADLQTKDLVRIRHSGQRLASSHHMRGKAEAARVTRKSPHRITWLSYHNKLQGLLGDKHVGLPLSPQESSPASFELLITEFAAPCTLSFI